jgi:CRISPR/Cas system-associated endonuclease Cas1
LIIEQAHEVVAQVPIEDIGVLILEHSVITITQPLIIECQENNTAVVFEVQITWV